MPPSLAWTVTALLLLSGIAGSVLPALPGAPLILVAAVWHEIFLPQYLAWPTILLLTLLTLLSLVLEIAMAAAGGKMFGGGKPAVIGAGIGSLIGLFFGPIGLLVGAVAGAAFAELRFADRPIPEALKAGLGAGAGLLASTVAKGAVAALMVLLFLLDCFLY